MERFHKPFLGGLSAAEMAMLKAHALNTLSVMPSAIDANDKLRLVTAVEDHQAAIDALLASLKAMVESMDYLLALHALNALGGPETKCWRIAHYTTQTAKAVIEKVEGEEL